MMEPSEEGRLDEAAVGVGGFAGAGRDLLREALVKALHVEVSGVVGEQAFEMAFAKDQLMVEALAANAAEEPVLLVRDFHAHHRQCRVRCQRRSVAGCTNMSASFHLCVSPAASTIHQRSVRVSVGRGT